MTAELKRDIVPALQLLPYAREVQAWLVDFLSAATHKKNPPQDYITNLDRRSGLFVDSHDINQAVDFISVIYAEHGYLTPWQLEDRLIAAYNPRLPREAMNIAALFSAFEQSRDRLTNYYQKPQTPLVMGLSSLYEQTQNKPVSIFEIDFSNMRGTNEHNEKVVKAAYPDLSAGDISEIAMDLTDQYAFIVANAILKSVEDNVNKDRKEAVKLIPLRTGGDEVRVVAVNMSAEEARAILPEIHNQIEAVTAMLGLHDHPHAKRPLDNLSNGFGAAGTTFPLAADGQFNDALAEADKEIAHNKVDIGRTRALYNAFSALKPASFDLEKIYGQTLPAARYLDQVHDTMTSLRTELGAGLQPPPRVEIVEYVASRKKLTHIPGKEEVQKMIFDTFLASIKHHSIELTPAQEKVLKIKVLKFPQDDPSSGALSSRDFPALAGVSLQVVRNMNDITGRNDQLWTIGASFHNLSGLNETLGHGYSNLVLRAQADIMRKSLHAAGIADEHFCMAHMGNGDFYAAIQPCYRRDGEIFTITAQDMNKVAQGIEERLQELNHMRISDFLKYNGITPPEGLPRHFAYLENPRDERLPGLRVSVSSKPYESDPHLNTHGYRQGGAVKLFINDHLSATSAVNKARWATGPTPQSPNGPNNSLAL